jgi:hypothetical protein
MIKFILRKDIDFDYQLDTLNDIYFIQKYLLKNHKKS